MGRSHKSLLGTGVGGPQGSGLIFIVQASSLVCESRGSDPWSNKRKDDPPVLGYVGSSRGEGEGKTGSCLSKLVTSSDYQAKAENR